MADRVGQQLGNYRLIRLLGEGGFAEVYLGEHIHLGTQAAIKVLHTQLTSEDVDKFRTEARTIARLIHPNIVRVLEFGVEGKTPFLVMDYATNGTLRQRHPKGVALPLPLIVAYVKQVADALQYAHNEKVIHRDIKPENMLLGRRQEVLLSDFGIALVAQSSRYQSPQDMAGTIAYMAPEQIAAHPRPASDQYSLGIVVYEWLCGERPFSGSFVEIAAKHAMTPPPPLREKVPTLPPEVEQVVLTALAKDPGQRFGSVQAFAIAFEQSSRAGQIHPSTSAQVIPVVNQPQPSPIMASQTMSLPQHTGPAVPLDTSAQTHSPAPPPDQSLQPVSPPSLSRPESAQQGISRRTIILGLGVAGLAVVGGGLTWLVSSRKFPLPSVPGLTPTPTPIPLGTLLYTYQGHSGLVAAMAWSPDGRRIASGSFDSTVQVWDAADGAHVFTYRGHSNLVRGVAWSPDGRRIASGSWDNTVQVWDAADGSNAFTYRGHSGHAVQSVAWSPDGRRIAAGSNDNTVQVWGAG